MKRWLLLTLLCGRALAACSGGSPTWTAASPSATDVQACITAASVGDTINVPSGTASWGAAALTLKAGGNKFIGASVITCSGTPGTSGYSCGAVDNTVITLTADQTINSTFFTSGVTTFQGFTFIDGSGGSGHGLIELNSTFGVVGFRVAYNHFEMPISGSVNLTAVGYGLVDHNFFDDQTSSSGAIPFNCYGNFPDYGYSNWNAAEQMGTNQSVVVEANYYTTSHTNAEGFFDGYAGCRITFRFNTIKGNLIGGPHGTETAPQRSGMLGEYYQNYVLNPLSAGLLAIRGGTMLFWGNTIPSDGAGTPGISLNYVRYGALITSGGGWGEAGAGLNWILVNGPPVSGWTGNVDTLNASNYQTSHTYGALSNVINTNGCNMQTVAGGTTGNAQPTCPAFGNTVTDNGGVVWVNVGGSTTASNLTGGALGWCLVNPDTTCAADSTCNALSGGDTCHGYVDGATPGSWACGFRDQVGCGHNQVLTPTYEWLNTGAGLPSPVLTTDNSSIIAANAQYYLYTGSFTGATGTGSGTRAARPATCTVGVAYWSTDQGSWNSSGSGGQGVLDKCTATNTWTSAYYTPYTYPHPLDSGAAPTSSQLSGVQIYGGVWQ